MSKIEIVYVCHKGHFQFKDDPDGDSCGTKNIGTIYVKPNKWATESEIREAVAESLASLHSKIEFWRNS